MTIKPLANLKIILTRPEEQSYRLVDELCSLGATVFNIPTIKITANTLNFEQCSLLHNLDQFDLIIFTSVNGVKYFIEEIQKQKADSNQLKNKLVACIGKETKKVAEQNGLKVQLIPQNYDSKSLAEIVPTNSKNILLPRSDIALDELPKALKTNGAQVTELPIYKTVAKEESQDLLNETINSNHIDYIVFASPSAINSFLQLISPNLRNQVENIGIIAIGPTTAEAARQNNFKSVYTAKTHTTDGIITTLKEVNSKYG